MKKLVCVAVLGVVVIVSKSVSALEGGVSNGAAAYGVDGMEYIALPPPGGIWLANYSGLMHADKIIDHRGNNSLPGAEIKTAYNMFRISWMPEVTLWGAKIAAFEVFPTYARSEFKYKGTTTVAEGWIDLRVNPFALAWTFEKANIGFSTTMVLPTGSYDQNRMLNLGNNRVTWTPQLFYSYDITPLDQISVHLGGEYNFTNNSGHVSAINPQGKRYKSGQVVHAEVAYRRYLDKRWAVAASVLGSYQYTDDKIYGDEQANAFLQDELDGNRYKGFGMGLSARYLFKDVIPITLTYTEDLYSRSRSEGRSLALRIIIPLMGP